MKKGLYLIPLFLFAVSAAYAEDFSAIQTLNAAGLKEPPEAVSDVAAAPTATKIEAEGPAGHYLKGMSAGVPVVQSYHQAQALQTAVKDNYIYWYVNAATIPNSHQVSVKIDGYEFGYSAWSPMPVRDFMAVIRKAVEDSIYTVRDLQVSGLPVWEISRREPLLDISAESSDPVIIMGNPAPNEISFATYRGLAVDGGKIKAGINGRAILVSTKRGEYAEDVVLRLAGEVRAAGFAVEVIKKPGSGEGINRILKVSKK